MMKCTTSVVDPGCIIRKTDLKNIIMRWTALTAMLLCTHGGCVANRPAFEPHGKTYYLDGAGGWGFGRTEVAEGLRRAGYLGDVEVFDWSPSRIPLIDQVDPFGVNKLKAKDLANRIKKYKQQWPKQEVNIIALSAGTGVMTWALERLRGKYKVDNVFYVGSSLASNYDIRRALLSVKGRMYVYFSPHDMVLQFVRATGTIDHQLLTPVAGMVGLKGKGAQFGQVVNIGWDKKWERLGWKGGHTDCVNRSFVQYEIARKLMNKDTADATLAAESPAAPSQNAAGSGQRTRGGHEGR